MIQALHRPNNFDDGHPKEAFDHRFVIAVRGRAHAAFDAIAGQLFAEVVAGVLAAAVRMVDERSVRSTGINGHSQRSDNQVPAHPFAHRPTGDAPIMEIQDGRRDRACRRLT